MNNDNMITATFTEQEIMMVDFALAFCANKGIFSAEGVTIIGTILDKMQESSKVQTSK